MELSASLLKRVGSLTLRSGAFEFIERGASYAAPVVLALIMRLARKSTYKSVTIPLRVKSKGENQKS